MTIEHNPYSPPSTLSVEPSGQLLEDELAGRFTRFASSMVDGILMMAVLGPIMILSGFYQRAQLQQAGVLEQLTMSLLGIGIMLAFNGYLLFSRGQTIGKLLTKIQIVDAQEGKLLPFVKVYAFRYLWLLPLIVLVAFIPGAADDTLVNLMALVDVLFIFGADRRCLHDYIAGSKVVIYQSNRGRIG